MQRNPVGWFEIYVQDMARAARFYETVLGVQLTQLPGTDLDMRAFPMQPEAGGASGALVHVQGVPSGGMGTMVYFSCADCATEAGRVVAAGGRIHRDKMSIGQYGHIVLAVDTEGTMFGLHSMA